MQYSQHNATMRAMARITGNRDDALSRLDRQRIDVTPEEQAEALGHRAVGFYNTIPAYSAGRHHFPPSSLGVAGPRGTLPR